MPGDEPCTVLLPGGVAVPASELADALETYANGRVMSQRKAYRHTGRGRIEPFMSHLWARAVNTLRLAAAGEFRAQLLPEPPRQSLTDWARDNRIPARTARGWAETGRLPTARKDGPLWTVATTEPPPRRNRP